MFKKQESRESSSCSRRGKYKCIGSLKDKKFNFRQRDQIIFLL